MAYIVQSVQSSTETEPTTSFVPDQWISETQQDNDYILLCAVNDGGGTALGISAGWTEIYKSSATVAGVRVGIWQAKRTTTDIPVPTISGANDDWIVSAMLIRDADPNTFLDVAIDTTEQTSFVTKYVAPSLTTTNNNTLIVRVAGLDANGVCTPASILGGFTDVTKRVDTAVELYVVEQLQTTAGATGTFTWDRSINRGGVLATIAIRNKTGGSLTASSSVPFTVVEEFTLAANSPTPVSIHTLRTSIAGITCLTPTAGPTVANQSNYTVDPTWYGPFVTVATTAPLSIGIYGGVFPVTADWSTGKLFAILAYTQLVSNVLSANGPIFYFEDNAGAWAAWQPISRVRFGSNNFKGIIADLPNETFIDSFGTIDWSNIVYFGMLLHQPVAPLNFNSRVIALKALGSIETIKFFGGGDARPLNFVDFAKISLSGGGIYRAFLQGSGQSLLGIPVQIGDGTNTTYFKAAAQSLEYQISGKPETPWFRLNELTQPFNIYASSSDVIDFSLAIIATTTRQAFTINSNSSTNATYIFDGASIVGWDIIWKNGINCDGASFQKCGKIDAKGSQFNDCSISLTRSTDAAIAFDANSSMTNTKIDVSDTSAAYHIELGTNVTEFTLTDVTLSGTPATNKVHVLKTSGTVTITLSGTTTLNNNEITSEGATIVIISGAELIVTNLVSGSRIKIVRTDTGSVLENVIEAGTSRTFSLTYTGEVRVEARNASGTPAYKPWFTIINVGAGATVTALQEID